MKRDEKTDRMLAVILTAQILVLMFLTWKFGIGRLDGDDSAEMILANLLAKEGGILNRNWFYSTEIRVLHNQIVMSLLFRVFKSWHVVRTLGTGILLSVLVLSYLFMCSRLPEGEQLKKWAPAVLMPFSYVYYDIVLYGLHYIPYISILFMSLGLLVSPKRRRLLPAPILLMALAFVAGLSGIRMPAIAYVPMFLAAVASFILNRDKKTVGLGFASCAATGFGYLVYHFILSKTYICMSHELSLTGLNFGMAKKVLVNTLQFLGVGKPRPSVRGIGGIAGTLLALSVAYLLILLIKNRKRLSVSLQVVMLTFAFSWILTASSAVFTTAGWANRYAIMPCMVFIPIIGAGMAFVRSTKRKTLTAVVIGALLITSATQVYRFVTEDKLADVRPAYDYILGSGYTFGYSTWEVGDVLTEVSDGRIHMCKVQNFENLWRWNWLMEKDYMKYTGDGPVFLLFDKERLNYTDGHTAHFFGEWTEDDLTWTKTAEVGFEDDSYVVWVFSSEQEFEAITGSCPHD